jgi:hypothetical protein
VDDFSLPLALFSEQLKASTLSGVLAAVMIGQRSKQTVVPADGGNTSAARLAGHENDFQPVVVTGAADARAT